MQTTKMKCVIVLAVLIGAWADENICFDFNTTIESCKAPPGSIQMNARTSNAHPDGWLATDGGCYNAVSNPQYIDLFNVLGTQFGGSGASSFCVPYLYDRFVYGQSNRAFGSTGGQTNVAISTGQMGQHRHTGLFHIHEVRRSAADDHNHSGNFDGVADSDAGVNVILTISTTCPLSAAGGNAAHNNLPSYYNVYYIIAY
jgi:microcystin-dependent protein